MTVSPHPIRSKIPKQGYGYSETFGGIDAIGAEQWLEEDLIHKDEDRFVDAQTNDIYQRELNEMFVNRVRASFGKRPQAIPSKIADDGYRHRNQICNIVGNVKTEDEYGEHGKINRRAEEPDHRKLDKAPNLGVGAAHARRGERINPTEKSRQAKTSAIKKGKRLATTKTDWSTGIALSLISCLWTLRYGFHKTQCNSNLNIHRVDKQIIKKVVN